MDKLLPTLKALGATSARKVMGPNGAFISYTIAGKEYTLPVGKKSQNGTLREYNVLRSEDGQLIATVNEYHDVESVVL